jgi:hypothetical protein
MSKVNVPAGHSIGFEDFERWMNGSSVEERQKIAAYCKESGIVFETPKVTTKEDVKEYVLKSGDDERKDFANTCKELGVRPDTTKEDVKAWFSDDRTKEELAEVVGPEVVNSVLYTMQNNNGGKARKDWRACFKHGVVIPVDVMFASLVDHMKTSGDERFFQLGLQDALMKGVGDDHPLSCVFFDPLEPDQYKSCLEYISGKCQQHPLKKLDACLEVAKNLITYYRDDETALQERKKFLGAKLDWNKERKNTVSGWAAKDKIHGEQGATSCDVLNKDLNDYTTRDQKILEGVDDNLAATIATRETLETRFKEWYTSVFPPRGVKRAADAVSGACSNIASGMKRAKNGVGTMASAGGQLALTAAGAAYNAGGVILHHAQPVMQGMSGAVMAIANKAMSDVPEQLALGGPQ